MNYIPKSYHNGELKIEVTDQLLNIRVLTPFPVESFKVSIEGFYTIKTKLGNQMPLFFYSNSLIKGLSIQAYLPKNTAILPRQFRG